MSIGARVSSIKMEDVQDALWMQRTIVKTWCMRGTLHLLASSDLPLCGRVEEQVRIQG